MILVLYDLLLKEAKIMKMTASYQGIGLKKTGVKTGLFWFISH
jgi:hypothetical protein